MPIAATSRIAASDTRATHEVQARRTPVSPAQLRTAIGNAYRRLTGNSAPAALLDTLTAQASLETGGGAQMYNYNFGGIKGASPQGDTANYLTHELVSGQNLTLRQGFRAYGSIEEGAEDYLRVLSHRFGPALSSAAVGDVRGFAHALKQAGYYTAPEEQYASALQSLAGQRAPAETLRAVPSMEAAVSGATYPAVSGATYPATDDLSRVLDAITSSALHPSTSHGDDS